MIALTALVLALGLVLPQNAGSPAQEDGREVVADIRVHGNLVVPADEIVRMSGLSIGAPLEAAALEQAAVRLRSSKRFERVEVLKRFASISNPRDILVVIVVDEGPVRIEQTNDPDQPTRVVRRRNPSVQFLPIFAVEDGYGVTYGVRLTRPNIAGARSRISLPASWGGEKRIGLEFSKDLTGPITRFETGAALVQRENPLYEQDDTRRHVWFRVDRTVISSLRVSGLGGRQLASFQETDQGFWQLGGEVVLDTRLDPLLARNAVYSRAAWERLFFDDQPDVNHVVLEVAAYAGIIGQSVVVARAAREDASGSLPLYLRPLLGGMDNLRGFGAGSANGDTLVSGSLELRTPLSSPLNFAKLGISVFVDAGAAYAEGERLADQAIKVGYGGSVWLSAAFIRLSVAVGHGVNESTHVHIATNVRF